MSALEISTIHSSQDLRRMSQREDNRRTRMRMQAIANALEGMSRAEAARLAGMERQALRDAVLRYNDEGLDGLRDRPKPGRPRLLDETQERELYQIVVDGPDVEREGLSAYTRDDLAAIVADKWDVSYHPGSIGRSLRRLGLSRQKTRPSNPKKKPAAAQAFKKSPGNTAAYCRYT